MELLRLLVAVGEVSEAGGRRTGEERRIVHLSATQLHPTPPNASPALVESPALPAGEAAAAGTKSILGLRDSAAACEPAPALWAPKWGWQLAQTPIWSWHGAEEPITRSPLKANAELVRTAFFWKLLVEDVGQSGWLNSRRTHFQEFLSLSSCPSV